MNHDRAWQEGYDAGKQGAPWSSAATLHAGAVLAAALVCQTSKPQGVCMV